MKCSAALFLNAPPSNYSVYGVYLADTMITHDEAVMQDKTRPALCHDCCSFHHSAVNKRGANILLHCEHTRIIILQTQLKSIPVAMYFFPCSLHTYRHTVCQMSLALTVNGEVEVLRQREWLIIQRGSLQSITCIMKQSDLHHLFHRP